MALRIKAKTGDKIFIEEHINSSETEIMGEIGVSVDNDEVTLFIYGASDIIFKRQAMYRTAEQLRKLADWMDEKENGNGNVAR